MGEPPCNLLEIEMALDRVEAQLAVELPAHMRAFAEAYTAGAPLPAAPDIAGRASTASIGLRALAHAELALRGVKLLRVVAPIVIERDATVAAARAADPTWDNYLALSRARNAVAHARFGRSALDVLHRLNGVADPGDANEAPSPIVGWNDVETPLSEAAIDEVWDILDDRYEVIRRPAVMRSDTARPRMFVDQAGSSGTVVIPRTIDTPAKRFAVLHELGHAVLNLSSSYEWSRVYDEAVASLVARLMETEGELPAGWYSPHAAAARVRRTELARWLAAIERHACADQGPARSPPFGRAPWALWHDPAAQAAYVAAESLADLIAARLRSGGNPRIASDLAVDANAADCAIAI